MPDLSGILDMLQKNPEIMKTAMSLFAAGGKSTENKEGSEESNSAEVVAEPAEPSIPTGFDPSSVAALLPALSGSLGKAKKDQPTDRRSALLCALKPYLSRERQMAIDYMLQFGKMGDLLKIFDRKE